MRLSSLSVLALAALGRASAEETQHVALGADGEALPFPTHCNPRRNVIKSYDNEGAQAILEGYNHTCNPASKNFDGEVLLYITPWNGGGFDVAKRFANKITYLSPVWLQMRDGNMYRAEDGESRHEMTITGTEGIDVAWMADVRAACGGKCGIYPRIVWEARNWDVGNSIQAIVDVIEKYKFDGIVLEVHINPVSTDMFLPGLVKTLKGLPEQNPGQGKPKVIFVLPPDGAMKPAGYAKLASAGVHRFSVMTYDHSSRKGQTGPNAPIEWVKSSMAALVPAGTPPKKAEKLKKKLLLGMPFYGYDNRQAILGPKFIDLLKEHNPRLKLNAEAKEHHFIYHGPEAKHTVHYPTPYFLQKRLEASAEYGGVAIWEAGQGLPYFYDLL